MPRWVDLSAHGVAIRLRENAQGKQLVLHALGNVPVTDDEATALEFRRLGDEYVRTGSQISMAEVRKVYPQVQVRDFTNEELAAPSRAAPVLHVVASTSAPPAVAGAAPIDRNASASAILRACTLSLAAFSEQATWRKNGATWRAALDGVELDIGSAATMCLRKLKPDEKMLLVAQDAQLRKSVTIDPTAGSIDALCRHPKRAYPGALSRGRQAEVNVMRLLAQLGVAERLMKSDSAHIKIHNNPYLDLVIERHAYSPNPKMRQGELMLTHYRHGNGDTWLDAEMVFGIDSGRLWLRETASYNPFNGGELRARDRPFANIFSRNLLNQGFGSGVIEWCEEAPEIDPTYVEPIDIVEGLESEDQVQMRVKAVRSENGWQCDWDLIPRRGMNFTHERASLFHDLAFPTAQQAMDAGIKDLGRRIRDLGVLGEIDTGGLGTSIGHGYDRCRAINEHRKIASQRGLEAEGLDCPGARP